MKKWTILATSLVLVIGFLLTNISLNFYEFNQKEDLITPQAKNENILGINQWLPILKFPEDQKIPQISAKAALFIESNSGETLFAKNPTYKLSIASLTKVMTTLIALEHKGMNEFLTVSNQATSVIPDKMYLQKGEELTLKDLLYGIFLISANDAAEVIAEGITGNRQGFINLMNSKASLLGMENTYFVNPTGFDEDTGNSYSTAYDLTLLTRYLIKHYPEVIDISKTPYILLPLTPTHQEYQLYSGINLLTTYPGVVGFKTGYTPEAGLTLITIARKNNHEIIGVLLGSENRREEARMLLDYSFNKLH